MPKKVAVIVIHGMGNQEKSNPMNTTELSFSKDLHRKTRKRIGRSTFDADVAWHEVYWADTIRDRMAHYMAKSTGKISKGFARRFIMNSLTDAATYRMTNDQNDTVYTDVNARVTHVFEEIERLHGANIPVVLAAHSLGGHILSNYIYDMQKPSNNGFGRSAFGQMETVKRLFTFGCNIPIFTFAYKPADIKAISFPGANPDDKAGWWQNYYDKQDVLGYPLEPLGGGYEDLVTNGELKEHRINAGNIFEFWNLMSHNAYWRDADFYDDLADYVKEARLP